MTESQYSVDLKVYDRSAGAESSLWLETRLDLLQAVGTAGTQDWYLTVAREHLVELAGQVLSKHDEEIFLRTVTKVSVEDQPSQKPGSGDKHYLRIAMANSHWKFAAFELSREALVSLAQQTLHKYGDKE